MKNIILLFIISSSAYNYILRAQDSLVVPKPPAFHTSLSSTAIGTNNTDNSSFVSNNNLKFNFAKDNVFINTYNSWIYGTQTAGLTNNDFFSSIDFNVFNKPSKFYYWALGTYEKNYSLKINDRFQGGLGLGYEIFYRPDLILTVSDGVLYEKSSLYDNITYDVLRNSFRFKHKFIIKKIVTVEGAHFWQQSFASWEDYIIKSNTTASVKLKKWLSFTAAVTYNKQSLTAKENFLYTVGLTFEKYF